MRATETIKTKSGSIIIKGNVYGQVKSMAGNITVHGFVSGKVETMSGNNYMNVKMESVQNITDSSFTFNF